MSYDSAFEDMLAIADRPYGLPVVAQSQTTMQAS